MKCQASRNRLKWQKYVQKKMNHYHLAIRCMYVCKADVLSAYLLKSLETFSKKGLKHHVLNSVCYEKFSPNTYDMGDHCSSCFYDWSQKSCG